MTMKHLVSAAVLSVFLLTVAVTSARNKLSDVIECDDPDTLEWVQHAKDLQIPPRLMTNNKADVNNADELQFCSRVASLLSTAKLGFECENNKIIHVLEESLTEMYNRLCGEVVGLTASGDICLAGGSTTVVAINSLCYRWTVKNFSNWMDVTRKYIPVLTSPPFNSETDPHAASHAWQLRMKIDPDQGLLITAAFLGNSLSGILADYEVDIVNAKGSRIYSSGKNSSAAHFSNYKKGWDASKNFVLPIATDDNNLYVVAKIDYFVEKHGQ